MAYLIGELPIPKYGAHLGLMQSCKPNAIVSILPMKHKGLLIYHWVYHIKKESTTGVAAPYQSIQPTDTNMF